MTADSVVLFWDIDGTLLTTARAGIGAWEDALAEIAGIPRDLSRFHTAGLVDPEIARRLLESSGCLPAIGAIKALCEAYARRLPMRLADRAGHVMGGIPEILAALRGRTDVRQYLLTGNLRACGLAKLRHYGITDLTEGAFADDAVDRADVARTALAIATRVQGQGTTFDRICVVGDTVEDVACARSIGARAIAVATGPHDRETLAASGAWRALDRLPPPAEFIALLGLPPAG